MHLVEFGEEFGDLIVRVAVVGEDIVADAVAAGPPDQPDVVARKMVKPSPNVAPWLSEKGPDANTTPRFSSPIM